MNRKLLDHLLKSGVCTTSEMQAAVSRQRARGGDLLEILLDRGVGEVELARALGKFYGWQVVDLSKVQPKRDALDRANGEFCRRHLVLPFAVDRSTGDLLIAVADPARARKGLRALQTKTGQKIRPYIAPRKLLSDAIETYYSEEEMSSLGAARHEISAIAAVPGFESQLGRRASSQPGERMTSIDHFFDESDSNLGSGRDSSFFGSNFGSGSDSFFGERATSSMSGRNDPMSSQDPLSSQPGFTTQDPRSSAELQKLREENRALRQALYRVETSLQLEINLLRELVELLLEDGVIDRRAYLEKLGKLR